MYKLMKNNNGSEKSILLLKKLKYILSYSLLDRSVLGLKLAASKMGHTIPALNYIKNR